MRGVLTRAVSALLVTLLAGAPAVAAVCDALCLDGADATGVTEKSLGPHHHGAAIPASAPEVDHAAMGHGPAGDGAASVTHAPEVPRLIASARFECCPTLGSPPASVAARLNAARLWTTPVAEIQPAVPSAILHVQPVPSLRAAPAAGSTPAPTLVVLRI